MNPRWSPNRPVRASVSSGEIGTQPEFGEFRERSRVALAVDQRLEHCAAGHPTDVGGHGLQFDPVLQQLLQPLDLPGPLPHDRGPGPGQIAQLTNRFGLHERDTNQPVPACASHAASDTGQSYAQGGSPT